MSFFEPKHDSEKIDLAFVIDCTGSMGSYIKQVQKHVLYIAETIARTSFDVRLGLIEYRDHPPQDSSFVTRNHDFTGDVKAMKVWVDQMQAGGGGDCPEAMADALRAASKLSYRTQATKMCVLITDAPPHGLGEGGDGFPNGCPLNYDPIEVCRAMARLGIILYCIGCEPSVAYFKDFLYGLSHITGGQYFPLRQPKNLTKAIISATGEEVSLEKLMGHVSDYVILKLRELREQKKKITMDQLADDLHQNLQINNVQCSTLQRNKAPLNPVTEGGKQYSKMKKMSQARDYHLKVRGTVSNVSVNEDGDVVIVQQIHVSKSQSERLLQRFVSRSGPVTHDELLNEVVVPDALS